MADLVVGRSEGVAYPNNNLTYRQFTKNNIQSILKKKGDTKMEYINEKVEEIKKAKTDNKIIEILNDVYVTTQMCSDVRKEFDDWYNSL
jgi:hypothetical protein